MASETIIFSWDGVVISTLYPADSEFCVISLADWPSRESSLLYNLNLVAINNSRPDGMFSVLPIKISTSEHLAFEPSQLTIHIFLLFLYCVFSSFFMFFFFSTHKNASNDKRITYIPFSRIFSFNVTPFTIHGRIV